ncbi:Oidioi.mRNA.OKI2018_I69.chr2.g4536.t1.cds [Oikopleura dioica]|uniref:Oidioi.mRNA.OKI2018_I69.chr2.g4536.t1.cds n=1 Tax=Oikopleura dioica TaxID=34765 RepID=A0ABN7T447_OIKDI|nr:Oidioi.mRNA.OKI2018_I69.chr2.g4536.t1.cds [Oikopleura dioica]
MSLAGKWKLDKNENFDEYMKKVGVSWVLRKAGATVSSTTEITQEGDGIRVNTQSTVKSANELFMPGVEKDVTTMDGRKVKSTLVGDLNGFTITEKWDGRETTLKWELINGEVVLTLNCEGVICKRTHKKC